MITFCGRPWTIKPLLTVSFLLILVAVTQTDAKKNTFVLRRWESTGIVNCTAQNEFACADKKGVLPMHQRCDGITQCKDKSDEQSCTECHTPFSVKREDGTLECINARELAKERANHIEQERIDGYPPWYRAMYYPTHKRKTEDSMYPKCTASEREKLWRNWTSSCAEGEKRCEHEPLCMPAGSVCDGTADCTVEQVLERHPTTEYLYYHSYSYNSYEYKWRKTGGNDENGCEQCTGGALKCDGKCVSSASLCDGKRDCTDGSDEKNCTCATCSGAGRALCGNGQCIDGHRVCDGVRDCEDASDEQNCPAACGAEITNATVLPSIITNWNRRYLKSEACTGACPDCTCKREECDCRTSFFCSSGEKCISKDMVCDGKRDCWDGSDEKNCLKACAKYPHFSCVNKLVLKCITIEHKCDGVRDCTDGSDEKKCDKCPADAHRCDGGCVPASKRCDGVKDCKDGSDEKDCSCEACSGSRLDTYSCENGTCLRRSAACAVGGKSLCPNPTARDELFCVRQSQRKGPEGTKKTVDTSRFWD